MKPKTSFLIRYTAKKVYPSKIHDALAVEAAILLMMIKEKL